MIDRSHFLPDLDLGIKEVSAGVVGLLLPAGFHLSLDFGGAVVWSKPLDDGELQISYRDEAVDGDPEDPSWILSRYHSNGGFVSAVKLRLADAVTAALPAPVSVDGDALELIVEDLDEVPSRWGELAGSERRVNENPVIARRGNVISVDFRITAR